MLNKFLAESGKFISFSHISMERYFLLIFDGLSAKENSFLLNYFGSEPITSDDQLPSSALLYHSSHVYVLNLKKIWKKHVEWKEVNTAHDILQLISKFCEDIDGDIKSEDASDSSLIAECINSLADQLPLPGTFVFDVLVGCNIFENFIVSDSVEFAASLHRLSKWHSARTAWLTVETDVASHLKEWLDLTNAEAIDINNCSQLTFPLWRGAIEFKDPNISTKCYKGFELKIDSENMQIHQYLNLIFNVSNTTQYLLLHPVLKATDVCCFSSIPHHLILPVPFKLCVSGNSCYDSSLKLCANIKEKNDAAVILRLGYSVLKEKPKPDKILSTNKWLKMVSSGNVKYPDSCLPDVDKFLTLAVVPSTNSDNMFAYIIRDPSCFDALFYFNAVSIQNRQSFGTSNLRTGMEVEEKEFSVPFVSETLFLSALQKAVSLHTDSDVSGTCENLSSMDTSNFLTSFLQCIDSSELGKRHINFGDVNSTYEEIDASDWRERIHLLQRQMLLDEEKKNKMNVFMSFSPQRSRYYVSFSGDDIKTYFEPSGEAKDNKIVEPIQSLGCSMNYNKDSFKTMKQKKWPEILNCVFDDIYYNATDQSEEIESVGNEMVKCYVQHETASTCNIHQNQPDAPISIQAKSMTPRKKPQNTSKSDTSFRQVMMNPDASVKKKFLKTAEVQSNPVISTIMKTLGVSKSSNASSAQSILKKRIPRKNSLPVRCSPRKKPSVDYYSASKGSTNKVQKSKAVKEKSSNSLPEILKKKLRSSIAIALESNGVNIEDALFKPCFKRLFTICQAFVQDVQDNPRKVGTSQFFTEIAEEHVKPVIKFEKQKKKVK